MLNLGYFEVAYNENNHLKITEAGKKVLFGQTTAQLVTIKREEKAARTRKSAKNQTAEQVPLFGQTSTENQDDRLFEELRQLRKKLADAQAIPPYIVLTDKTLHLLATLKPTSIEAFGEISGIGEYKKEKYGKDFITVIRNVLKV